MVPANQKYNFGYQDIPSEFGQRPPLVTRIISDVLLTIGVEADVSGLYSEHNVELCFLTPLKAETLVIHSFSNYYPVTRVLVVSANTGTWAALM